MCKSMQVAVTAFYQTPDAAARFATTFFNQTIDIVETKKMIDFELISLYATILALLAGVGAPMRERCVMAVTCHMHWSSCFARVYMCGMRLGHCAVLLVQDPTALRGIWCYWCMTCQAIFLLIHAVAGISCNACMM